MTDEKPVDEKPVDEKSMSPHPIHPCPICGKELERRCGGPRGCGWTCECGYDSRSVAGTPFTDEAIKNLGWLIARISWKNRKDGNR